MKAILKILTHHFLWATLIFVAHTAVADTLMGRVIAIADGDTVTVLDTSNTQFKIRLMGIDAPEEKMPFGQKSKEHLSSLVFNQQVAVEYNKRDKYGRTVGKILLKGVDVNLEQVKAGLAWHYKQYQQEQTPKDRAEYIEAEILARDNHLGLWADINPTSPWDWRHTQKEMQ